MGTNITLKKLKNNWQLFLSLVVLGIINSCNEPSVKEIDDKVVLKVVGTEIFNNTLATEDCNFSSVLFSISIENRTLEKLSLIYKPNDEICAYQRMEPDMQLICQNGDTLQLKLIPQFRSLKPNSSVRMKCLLRNYEIKGSLSQIKKSLFKKIGNSFQIVSDQVIQGKTCVFNSVPKLSVTNFLNEDVINEKDTEKLNLGKIDNPVFEMRTHTKFIAPTLNSGHVSD